MEANQQTSFIPKRPLVNGEGKVHHTTNFFSIIAIVVFITVLALAGVVFAYQSYLNSSLTKTKSNLETVLAQFQPDLISQLSRLDNRIETAKALLDEHVAPSGFFTFLANETLQNIRFTSFSYTTNGDGTASVVMSGQATSFAAVASEAAELSSAQDQTYFQDPLFSDLNLDASGNITFTLSGTVNTNAFLYRSTVNASSAPAVTASSTPVATNSATTTSTSSPQ
jgi:hypothetical protein